MGLLTELINSDLLPPLSVAGLDGLGNYLTDNYDALGPEFFQGQFYAGENIHPVKQLLLDHLSINIDKHTKILDFMPNSYFLDGMSKSRYLKSIFNLSHSNQLSNIIEQAP